ncbi:MAG: hypothetical protein GX024_09075 [Clostridiales bacterium]|nr:hypothetical protein [Clostridiales bacterium]
MNYLIILLILICSGYSLSYARYSWRTNNRWAAVGVIVLVALSVILPVLVMFFR